MFIYYKGHSHLYVTHIHLAKYFNAIKFPSYVAIYKETNRFKFKTILLLFQRHEEIWKDVDNSRY